MGNMVAGWRIPGSMMSGINVERVIQGLAENRDYA